MTSKRSENGFLLQWDVDVAGFLSQQLAVGETRSHRKAASPLRALSGSCPWPRDFLLLTLLSVSGL